MLKPTEFQIHRAICWHLTNHAHHDVAWWHTPNGGARSKIEGRRLKDMGTKAGIPDLFLLHRAKLHAIEVKAPGGKISPVQNTVALQLLEAGLIDWQRCDSLVAAARVLHLWGLTRPNVDSTQ